MRRLLTLFAPLVLAGCSVVGQSDVETAPYTLITADQNIDIEVRNYNSMVLVSSPMPEGEMNDAFRNLFRYITGENEGTVEIAMTAPVFMDEKKTAQQGTEIAMTAPVFMDENSTTPVMSFVMPVDFTMETTPKPTNPDVWVSEVTDYKVAVIRFSGTLSDSNVDEYTDALQGWIADNGYTAIGEPVNAAYNGPLTIPVFRRNEILIQVQ